MENRLKVDVRLDPCRRAYIVDEFSSAVPDLNFNMCVIWLEIKTHLLFRNHQTSSELPENFNDLPSTYYCVSCFKLNMDIYFFV